MLAATDLQINAGVDSGTAVTTLANSTAGLPIDLGTNTAGKNGLAQGELEMKLAESPEFYWSKIERQIERGEQAEQVQSKPKFASLAALRRLLAPAAGVALVAFLTVYTFKVNDGVDDSTHPLAVVENLSEHTGAYSFRSQSEKMFVVWLYDRSDETLAEPDSADEQVDQ